MYLVVSLTSFLSKFNVNGCSLSAATPLSKSNPKYSLKNLLNFLWSSIATFSFIHDFS